MIKLIIISIVAVVVIGGGFLFVKKRASQVSVSPSPTESSTQVPEPTPTPTPVAPILPEVIKVTIVTARGNIQLDLYSKVAPRTVDNFVKLANSGYYDGIKFHRVVADFVIQGGDPLSKTDDPKTGSGGPGYTFQDEINPKALGLSDSAIAELQSAGYVYDLSLPSLPMDVGAIAMANAGPNTNGSQFFIVTTKPQPYLNGKHTVFGKVIKGMDVVLKIKQGDVIKKITTDYKPTPSPSASASPTGSTSP